MTVIQTAVPDTVITEDGLSVPEVADVLSGRKADISSSFGGGLSPELSTPQGQMAVSDTAIIAQVYDKQLVLFNQINPDFASGRFQDAIGRVYFMDRISAAGTVVTATCFGIPDTVIPSGSTAIDRAGYIYQTSSNYTIPASKSIDVQFTCLTTGPIQCGVGDLDRIYRPLSGWDSVYNANPGVIGSDVESRIAFETRRQNSVARNSRNQDASTLAAVLAVSGVLDAYVWSNRKDTTEPKGTTSFPVAPHSVYIGVYGGSDQDVAEAIFSTKNPGANLNGNTTVVVEDKENYSAPYPQYDMQWEKVSPLRIYFKVEIDNDIDNLPSDVTDQIKSVVALVFNGTYEGSTKARIGSRISGGTYYAPIIAISPNYMSINSISLSRDGVSFVNSITVGIDEIPTIQESDIEVIKS